MLDGEIVSRPIINFVENPDGIDGRTGAQISGSFTIQEAQDLAEFLRIGALPIDLKLISQSTVSATLGQQALDQGLKAGARRPDPRRALPDRLLPLPRPGRGARPARLRALLLRADQADPDHADPAGDRGADPHDRRRGRRQHRHLRANKGGGRERALDAVGDRRGLPQGDRDDRRRERDHADHGVHPLRARDRRASRDSRSRSASARSSRCSPRCCSRRRCSALSGGRSFLRSPRLLGAGEQRVRWHFDFTGASRVVLLDVGRDPGDRRDRVRDQAAQPRDRLRVRDPDQGGLGEAATVEDVRTALSDAGIDGAGGAEIQEVDEPDFGDERGPDPGQDPARAGRRGPDGARRAVRPRGRGARASRRPASGRPSASRWRAAR